MLKICSDFAHTHNIIFNSKKTMCIKYGSKLNGEKAFFNGESLSWVDKVRHLGNYVDNTCTDFIDCKMKK